MNRRLEADGHRILDERGGIVALAVEADDATDLAREANRHEASLEFIRFLAEPRFHHGRAADGSDVAECAFCGAVHRPVNHHQAGDHDAVRDHRKACPHRAARAFLGLDIRYADSER